MCPACVWKPNINSKLHLCASYCYALKAILKDWSELFLCVLHLAFLDLSCSMRIMQQNMHQWVISYSNRKLINGAMSQQQPATNGSAARAERLSKTVRYPQNCLFLRRIRKNEDKPWDKPMLLCISLYNTYISIPSCT